MLTLVARATDAEVAARRVTRSRLLTALGLTRAARRLLAGWVRGAAPGVTAVTYLGGHPGSVAVREGPDRWAVYAIELAPAPDWRPGETTPDDYYAV